MRRNNNFNLLRLILATLVILAHSSELIDGDRHRELLTRLFHTVSFGELAVDGFFVISGFLILQSWLKAPDLGSFIKKRVSRIYPGFVVASILSALVVAPYGSSPSEYFHALNPVRLVRSIALLQLPDIPPAFVGQPHPFVNGSMWTISYEFRCYLLVAVVGSFGLLKQKGTWPALWVGVSACSVSPCLVDWIAFPGLHTIFGNPGQLAHFLAFFTAGGCYYLYPKLLSGSRLGTAIALGLLFLCMFSDLLANLALVTLGSYCLLRFAFAQFSCLDIFRRMSDISYGVYLYGWPIQKLLVWHHPSISPWTLFSLSLLLAVLCGLVSWHFIERPFLRSRAALKSSP